MKTIKAQGLPINMVVMLILGIVIFGLGMGLFATISGEGDDQVAELEKQMRDGISSLECDNGKWICSPTQKLQAGESNSFKITVSNKGDENGEFYIKFKDANENKLNLEKEGCGTLYISYPSFKMNVKSGEANGFLFIADSKDVTKSGCSFVAVAELYDSSGNKFIEKTPVIIQTN